jgi:cadmium resistance protein CadD (predicted permease)
MSWAVFWITPTDASPQISIAVTSMLTLIAYRFAIDNQLPRLPYTTHLDAFILMSTVLVFFSFIEVLVTTILENQKRNRLALTIDRSCRVIFPVIFLLASMSILFIHAAELHINSPLCFKVTRNTSLRTQSLHD